MSEGMSERERLARALWLEFYDWTSSWEATDQEQWRASADVLLAAGFGDVAQITAERDAAKAALAVERKYSAHVSGRLDSALCVIIYGPIVAPPWMKRYAEKGAK